MMLPYTPWWYSSSLGRGWLHLYIDGLIVPFPNATYIACLDRKWVSSHQHCWPISSREVSSSSPSKKLAPLLWTSHQYSKTSTFIPKRIHISPNSKERYAILAISVDAGQLGVPYLSINSHIHRFSVGVNKWSDVLSPLAHRGYASGK